MKKSFKGFLACLLALMLVLPIFSGVMAESVAFDGELNGSVGTREAVSGRVASERNGTLVSRKTASFDLSAIRNGKTFRAAEEKAADEIAPDSIVTIMIEMDGAPAADVVSDLKSAGSYRDTLVAKQNAAAARIAEKLGVKVEVTHNYSVLFNGFAFDGEYRRVDEINAMGGMRAFVSPSWESPLLFNTVDQVGAVDAWELGYDGTGYTVAILDTGGLVSHPAFSVNPTGDVQFTETDIAAIIADGGLAGDGRPTMNVSNVYVSPKIPFQWNYYYNQADAAHPGQSDHGTHVAGIAAANNDVIKGVAPEAQIAVMQVFAPSGGASWSNIIPALEDCAVLGVSAANLSLGSPNGSDTPYDPSFLQTLERCVNAGVNIAMAAGNDYDATFNNAWGGNVGNPSSWSNSGYALASNPDNGVVGSPSTWPHGISVAAISNSKSRFNYVEVEGEGYGYSENSANPVQMIQALGGQTVPYVVIPGFGTPEDYAQVDVNGKIALVSRGDITFIEKAQNAEAAGAVACVVYNNQAASVNMVAYEGGHIPHVIVTQEAGAAMIAAENKTMFIGTEMGVFDNPSGNMTTSFSSRGFTSNMSMKPEITAPGGQIYSSTDPAISGTLYDTWDGTSMATPHVCGGMAIISAYVDDNFPNASVAEKQALVNQILMSTASPILSGSGDFAPVHEQGAGAMDLYKATKTKAYLTVNGTVGNRPKVELGDDPEKTGHYEMTFTVHNFGENEQQYAIMPSVLLNDLAMLGTMSDGSPVIVYSGNTWDIALGEESEVLIGDANGDGRISIADAILIARMALGLIDVDPNCDINEDEEVNIQDAILAARISLGLMEAPGAGEDYVEYVTFDMPEVVIVPAGGSTDVTVKFDLTDEITHYLDTYYTSGAQIEGFIELLPASDEDVYLTLPFTGFYGDWNYAATIDRGYYYEDEPWNSNNYPNTIGYRKGSSLYGLGINPYVETEDMSYYLEDRNAISPNGDSMMDSVNVAYTGLLRNSYVRYLVCDENGNQIEQLSNPGLQPKGFWKDDHREQLGVTSGAFPAGVNFASFNREDIIIRIEAKLDNDGAHGTNPFTVEASENWKWDVPVHIDSTLPTVSNYAVSANGASFDVTDDHYVAYVGVFQINGENLGDLIAEQGVFETERGAVTHIEITHNEPAYVVVADYAMNEQAYLWDGVTLTPIDQAPQPEPFTPPTLNVYAYGKNLTTQTWVRFATNNLSSLYYGGGIQADDGDYTCAALAGDYMYAVTAAKQLVRYDCSNINAWTGKTVIGTINSQYVINEMAYNRANGKLYIVEGLGSINEIDPATGAMTVICEPENGVAAFDFDRWGNCYVVDAFGYLCKLDLATGTEIEEIGFYDVVPLNSSGQFLVQSGLIAEGAFFWMSADANISQYNQMHLLAIDLETGDYVDLGSVYDGLYPVGIFTQVVDLPEASIEPVDFYDNFDGPFNWETIDADGDGMNWGTDYFAQGLYYDGSKCAVSYSWQDVVIHPDNWMVSPSFDIGSGEKYLSFFTASANPADGDIYEHFQVLIIPEGTEVENGTVVYETTLETNAVTEHLVDISQFAGQNVQIAFRHYDCFDQYTLIVDAVGVGNHK